MYAARILGFVVATLLLARPALAQGPLTPGVPGQGHLSGYVVADVWTFSGVSAGDTLVFAARAIGANGFAVDHTLTDPNGATRFGGYTSVTVRSILRITAPLSGTYSLRMQINAGSPASGDYEIVMLRLPGAFAVPPGDQGGPLTPGVTVNGQAMSGNPEAALVLDSTRCASASDRFARTSAAAWVRDSI